MLYCGAKVFLATKNQETSLQTYNHILAWNVSTELLQVFSLYAGPNT